MTRPHHYEHCDVPEGMTLAEYRARRHPVKPRRSGLSGLLRRRRPAEAVAPRSGHDDRRYAA